MPTVRLDIPAPLVKSVANTQNYGNEADAHQLIHPTTTADRGVNEENYIQARRIASIFRCSMGVLPSSRINSYSNL